MPARLSALSPTALLWAMLAALTLYLEAPLPATDVFLFKEPGVRLAEEGKLVASDLPHQAPGETRPYAYYPPLFPLAFGAWTHAVGLGVKRSLAFDLILRTLRTLCLLLLLLPMFRRARPDALRGVVALLLVLCWLTSDGDRPDELGLVLGLSSWLCLLRLSGWTGSLLAGVALGLCAGASPACGALFALGHFLWWLSRRRVVPLAVTGLVAAGVFAGVNLPIYLEDPEAFVRFSQQAALSNFPYLEWRAEGVAAMAQAFGDAVSHSAQVAFPYLWAGLLLPIIAWVARARAQVTDEYGPFLLAAAVYLPLSLVVWTLQPYYWWFVAVAALVPALGAISNWKEKSWMGLVAVALALLPIAARFGTVYLHAWQVPAAERAQSVAERVMSVVPRSASLAVTPDQYLALRPERRVANLAYACGRLDGFDFLYVSPLTTRRDRWFPDPIPCFFHRECFEPIAQLSAREPLTILGQPTRHFVRGNGGTIYQNTRCVPGASGHLALSKG